ncbi:MAG: glycosyltransferase family 9 protein [Massilia sp.]
MSTDAWRAARKLLCVRLDSLGDVLMCTPAMRALRQSLPDCSLTLLSSPSGAATLPFIPELDRAISYAAPWMKHSNVHGPGTDALFLASLAGEEFDGAVIFTSYSQSALPAALLCYQAGIPLRLAHCRENPYQLLSHWAGEPEPKDIIRHEVKRQLDLVARIGCETACTQLSFAVSERDLLEVTRLLAEIGVDARQPFLLLHPGASAPSRRYPPHLWVQTIQQLSDTLPYPIVLTGDDHETALVEQIRADAGVPVASLAGRLDLGQLGAAIRLAAVMVCNNTGPAHMAAAVGTPLVDLYALTNPQHTPWQVPNRVLFHDVPCRFCQKSVCPQGHNDCLAGIDPARVVAAVRSLLHVTL